MSHPCSCCKSKAQMVANHGTPDEFSKALYRAFCDLFIDHDEMIDAEVCYLAQHRSLPDE